MSVSATARVPRVREAGDSALLLTIGATHASPLHVPHASPLQVPPASPVPTMLDWSVTARAIAIAADIRRRDIPGVRDVVSTFRSVGVFFAPLSTDVDAVAAALHEAADASESAVGARSAVPLRTMEVPVAYGGEFGPDLEEVAGFARCTPEQVIERHASRTYRVFMLGFLPGFPYMGTVDDSIAAPRRATPRVRVPAGAVGIAGRQTGVYPRESPGGWQIIGRTPLQLFDPDRTPPALFAPGDQVRFVPTTEAPCEGAPYVGGAPLHGPPQQASRGPQGSAPHLRGRSVTVLRPGLLTTVQDSGRWGYQDSGVPVAGPMDPVAHRLANALVGNAREAATLETTLLGPELRIEQDTTIAVAGADLQARLDREDVPGHTPIRCRSGSVLHFGERRAGARAYVAFAGGVAVPPVLGSRATHVLSGLGGIEGRALKAGDRIPLGEPTGQAAAGTRVQSSTPLPVGGACLRVLPGPQADVFAPDALEMLQRARFTISPQSDRMGYRLTGGATIARSAIGEMVSDVTFPGALQVPPSGEPILLMADRQTTGGYPQIAIVITADLPLAAQLAPGDWIELRLCTRADAIAALVAQEGKLLAVR